LAVNLKIPAFLADHPFEGLVAAILLLGLLFISADSSYGPAFQSVRAVVEGN
jgi:hypothetical protein